MDVTHLKSDELLYELELRNISPNDPNKLRKLQDLFTFEKGSRTAPPLDSARLTRKTIQLELKECDDKLSDIAVAIDKAKDIGDEELFLRGRSRLLHITARVLRLKRFAPELHAVQRLLNRTLEVAGQCAITRDCIENVQIEVPNVPEQIEAAGNSSSSTGAIPKRTSSSPPRSLNNEPRASTNDKAAALAEVGANQSGSRISTPHEPRQAPAPHMQQLSEEFSRMLAIHLQNAVQQPEFPVRPAEPLENLFAGEPHRNNHIAASNGQVQQYPPRNRSQFGGSYRSDGGDVYDEAPRRDRHEQRPRPNLTGGHRIHQWSLRFDGGPDSLDAEDFLFRVERQAELYEVSQGALVIGFGELLRGRAEQWYWTFQRQYGNITWLDLTTAFLRRFSPHRETDYALRSKIEARKQRSGEPFQNFCQDIEALASRLTIRMPQAELVEILQRNMHMNLRKALWRERVHYVDELIRICTDYERLCKEEEAQHRRYRVHEVAYETDNQINGFGRSEQVEGIRRAEDLTICFNCKEMGHRHPQCRVPQNHIFCVWCGADGVLSGNCRNCAENYPRGGPAAVTRPPQQSQQPRQKQILGPPHSHQVINKFSRPPPSY